MRRPIVAANWKLNGSLAMLASLLPEIVRHAQQHNQVEIVLAPPYPYLQAAVDHTIAADNIHIAAQNIARQEQGAFTGEVAAAMVRDAGCEYVIIGHSERRQYFAEDNGMVAEKVTRALDAGLKPILCVGESLQERQHNNASRVITEQIRAVIDAVGIDRMQACTFAYEPVWAIGTGQTATPQQAQEVHAIIRAQLRDYADLLAANCRIIYGGSVKPDSATELFLQADIDGGLIGGAALDAQQFNQIISSVPDLETTQ